MLDADDDLESMWDPEEDEDDMQDNKFSSHSSEGDGDDEADVVVADVMVADSDGERHCEDKEDSSDDFFDSGEGAVIGPDRLSLRAASESGQSGSDGGTEDYPVGPVTLNAAAGPTASITYNNKPTAVDLSSRTILSSSKDLDDEEWVDPTPIPPTPLEYAPPTASHPQLSRKLNHPATLRVGNSRRHAWTRMYRSRRAWGKVCRRTGYGVSRRDADEHCAWKGWWEDAERWRQGRYCS